MCGLGYCHAFLLSTAGVDGLELFSLSWTVPNHPHQRSICFERYFHPSSGAYKNVHAALGIVMWSADNNKEHCISCISLVI
jgi:hypothetical protein